jgi:hypothetical protein
MSERKESDSRNQLEIVQPETQVIYHVQLDNGFVATNPWALHNATPGPPHILGRQSELLPR